ncbi:AAA family ATPase [Ectothiorhodospiraceae bacterium 2226]|nr:AAA family ATPase [Ectothiorhodospiraceae bacterium 2226]
MNEAEHDRLVKALCDPALYPHGARHVHHVRTHISSLLLTGPYVYKLKRPVDFGFLNFTRLDDRRHYCEEELRLNRRLAPGMYVDVVPIYGMVDAPRLTGEGPVLEYAVRMVQLPAWRADWATRPGAEARLRRLARRLAHFHAGVPRSDASSPYGTPEIVARHALDNFRALAPELPAADAAHVAHLEAWSRAGFRAKRAAFEQRRVAGYVRECHGDLHLGNVALVHGMPRVFDCIEFDPELRWIDVLSELAFLLMDLLVQGQRARAVTVLDTYLAATGDYAGLALLDDYLVYRALVRAKVAVLSHDVPGAHPYLAFAERVAAPGTGAFVLTCGVSGSGKSYVSDQLLAPLGAVRLRSDVERKRLYPEAAPGQLHAGRYSAAATEHTYTHLAEQAAALARAGMVALVDATFLERARRETFYGLARALGVPCAVLHFDAPAETLRARVQARAARGGDASEADLRVLEAQLAGAQPPEDDEPVIRVSSAGPLDVDVLLGALADYHVAPQRYLATPAGG